MTKKIMVVLLILPVAMAFLSAEIYGSQANETTKKVIFLADQPSNLPFSPAILIKDTLFISGQLSMNPETGKFEGRTITEQAERIIKNIEILCKKAGMDLSHIVQTTVFITDFAEFAEFNAVFRKMFSTMPPTRATVQVAKLAQDAKIEISAIAMK
jgi:2-iminobutanoate/2-iminopropanoate deaminase